MVLMHNLNETQLNSKMNQRLCKPGGVSTGSHLAPGQTLRNMTDEHSSF